MRAIATISALTVTRGIVNFGLQAAVAARFGAGRDADAYFIVLGLIVVLSDLLVSLLTFAALPVLIQRWQAAGTRDRAWPFELALVMICSGLALLTAIVLLVAGPVVAEVLAPGFSAKASDITANLLRLSAAGFGLYTIALVLGVALQAQQRFWSTALVPVLPVAFALVGLAVLPRSWTIYAPIAGFNVGSVVALAMQIALWRRLPGDRPLRARPRAEELAHVLRRVGPMAVVVACGLGLLVMLRAFASTVGVGAVAAIGFAGQVVAVPVAILITPVATVLLARFSALLGQPGGRAARVLNESVAVVLLGSTLAAAVIAALAKPIVRLAFDRGSFTAGDVATTTTALRYMAIGLVALAVTQIVSRGLVALGSLRVLAVTWVAALVAFAVVGGVLASELGVGGLTAAYSGVWFVLVAVFTVALRHDLPELARGWLVGSVGRVLVAGGAAAATSVVTAHVLSASGASSHRLSGLALAGATILSALTGSLAFVAAARLMNGPEQRIVLDFVRRRGGARVS